MKRYMDTETLCGGIFGTVAIIASIFGVFLEGTTPAVIAGAIKDISETLVVVMVFLVAIRQSLKKFNKKVDKLDYLDNWEENKSNIYTCADISRFIKEVFYGMQAAIYAGETETLYARVRHLLETGVGLNREERAVLTCLSSTLGVFVVSHRLTRPLTKEQFDQLWEDLSVPYEQSVKDPDLAAWCKIMRIDKQQLCLEQYAGGLTGAEKSQCLQQSLVKCDECLALIEAQVEANPVDAHYALLYRAFAKRNIAQQYKKLNEIEPNPTYQEKEKQYCAETLREREELYYHYQDERDADCITMDYLRQEYVLAVAEQIRFETDPKTKERLIRLVNSMYISWKDRNKIRNMIFDQIERELATFVG